MGSIRRVRFSQSTLRQASIRENKGPSLGKVQVKLPHQRSPYAMKSEDAPAARHGILPEIFIDKLKEKDKATFYSPSGEWILPVTSIRSQKKDILWWIPELVYAYGQQERP